MYGNVWYISALSVGSIVKKTRGYYIIKYNKNTQRIVTKKIKKKLKYWAQEIELTLKLWCLIHIGPL